ncbi:mediator-associated protein 1-like [Cocos nucifera]|uniref:Mediator-associated protein 1-like n=1 Tax=Cocos nucifera TaxID=13894 RepID=A0A8K0MUZ0_COCNU|nr:mediator-associated protein 1-like [Cocos nucifera]
MAPKRPAVEATSSSSSDEAASSSDEEHEETPLSSPSPDKTIVQKKPTNPPAPATQAPKSHSSQRPAPASSDEDEDDSEDEEETSASESDDDHTKKQPPPAAQPEPPPPKPAPQPTASGSSDGSGSGSDSDEESSDEEPAPVRRPSRGADPSIKPISSKPMDEAPQPKKPAAASLSPKKKAKTSEPSENDGGGQKRPLFQRLWSPDDEIAVLSGLVEYRSKKGNLPSSHEMDQLHNLIRGSLQVEVSNNQLNDKIRRLKKKFETNVGRGRNGADPTFSKPQERTVFELSKKIWGAKKIVSEDPGASSGEEDEDEESDSEMAGQQNVKDENAAFPAASLKLHDGVSPALPLANGSAKLRYPFLSGAVTKMANECKCGTAMKRALENLEDPKARAMEEKVKKLKMGEMKLHVRRMDLMKETVKHIFEALAKSD